MVLSRKPASNGTTALCRIIRDDLGCFRGRGHILSLDAFEMLVQERLALPPGLRVRVDLGYCVVRRRAGRATSSHEAVVHG